MNSSYVNGKLLVSGLLVFVVALLVIGITRVSSQPAEPIGAETVIFPRESDSGGFAQAAGPWNWEFPRDHGPHPAYQTEWWYYTGNLTTTDGRRFGYQFTIFRRALTSKRA